MYQHIGIIIGGNNSEREVSKKSGENVAQSLIKSGYSVDMFSVPEDLPRFLVQYTKLDFVFVMIHGLDGEDGKIPALLELLGIPFQ